MRTASADGICAYTLQEGYCSIDGTCVEADAADGDNPCSICDPESATDMWTVLEDGSACGEDATCQSGVCVPNCTPNTECAEMACGDVDDGCGGTLTCGECAAGQTCSEGMCTPGNIAEVAEAAGTFTSLLTALSAASLADTIANEGPFTVFAPTDEAFEASLAALDLTLEELAEDTEMLSSILLYHVVSGRCWLRCGDA